MFNSTLKIGFLLILVGDDYKPSLLYWFNY